jgi:cell fate regulator YaaT (PSP1 superfamily)
MSKIGIKFIKGGRVFTFDDNGLVIPDDTKVVVETIRGIEIGISCPLTSEENLDGDEIKPVVRIATDEDLKKMQELQAQDDKVKNIANSLIEKYKLDMKIVDISFTLDGSKVIINYICEDRVDFRELVKDLASQLHLRIELRQIGIRDQAKILGGIGFCGKECCCKQYLNDFDKVSIKMAKTQGLSLNPTKISGICGRLMCCLSYENDFYSEIAVKMPKLNGKVKTKDGMGTVVYNNLLKQKVTVRIENDNEIKVSEYDLNDIEIMPKLQQPAQDIKIDKEESKANHSEKKLKEKKENIKKDNKNFLQDKEIKNNKSNIKKDFDGKNNFHNKNKFKKKKQK